MQTVTTPSERYSDAVAQLERVQAAQSAVIGAYMQAARTLWQMPDARDCEVRARAWEIAEGYHHRAGLGEDAGVRGYIECLPPSMAIEYATAITLSTQVFSVCRIHGVKMWSQRDGRCSHWIQVGEDRVRCFGLNSQDGGGNWTLEDNYCEGVPTAYDTDDAEADNAAVLAEMPELAALTAHLDDMGD